MRNFRRYLPKNKEKAKKRDADYSKLVDCSETSSEYHHRIRIKLVENPDADWDRVAGYFREEADNLLKVPPDHKKTRYDAKINALSIRQKDLRLRAEQSCEEEKIRELETQRQKFFKELRSLIKKNKETENDGILEYIESAHDSAKLYKAVKVFNRKSYSNPIVDDKDGYHIAYSQLIHNKLREHFSDHFMKDGEVAIERHTRLPSSLDVCITASEVLRSVKKMSNRRAPGYQNKNVELITYGPKELMKKICFLYNDMFENHTEINLARGILTPLPKPCKPRGPVKNFRPVILLPTIRKVLSNITLATLADFSERHLSASHSAYRTGRSNLTATVKTHSSVSEKKSRNE